MITFDYLLEIPMDVPLGASMVEDIEDYVDKHLSVPDLTRCKQYSKNNFQQDASRHPHRLKETENDCKRVHVYG